MLFQLVEYLNGNVLRGQVEVSEPIRPVAHSFGSFCESTGDDPDCLLRFKRSGLDRLPAWSLFADPHPDAMRGVPLLVRCSSIRLQDAVDECRDRFDLRPWPFRRGSLLWDRATQRLTY